MASFRPEEFLLPAAISLISHFIRKNDGNEVLIVGKVDSEGLVYHAELFAMGNEWSVPAVLKAAKPGDVIIHNHPSGDIRPSGADLSIAAQAAENRIGSYIVDNAVGRLFPVVRWLPPEETAVVAPTREEIEAVFIPEGLLAKAYQDYEYREVQLTMALAATDTIAHGGILMAEAGTGTGKSFSYLVPALYHAKKNQGRKTVVSTSTIALEEQLSEKDIPFLKEKLKLDNVPVTILKGRGNYLCLRKYKQFREGWLQLTIDGSSVPEGLVEEIDQWVELPHDGSKSSLSTAIENEVWGEIASDEYGCERSRCRHFAQCFFYKARRRANFASIVLVNHHLLMADISLRAEGAAQGILPKFDILVIDEAHNLFRSAVSFLGRTVTTAQILTQLKKLFNPERATGLLVKLLDLRNDTLLNSHAETAIRDISLFLPVYQHSVLPEFMEFFSDAKENYLELDSIAERKKLGEKFIKAREFLAELLRRITPIVETLKNERERADMMEQSTAQSALFSLSTDIEATIERISEITLFLEEFFLSDDTAESVFWSERTGRITVKLSITPLDIQEILKKSIHETVPAIILTSATLATGSGDSAFDFFKRETGLAQCNREQTMLALPSCFDYEKNLKAFIPLDIPDPNARDFEESSVDAVREIITASGGGALVLFTSIRHREAARQRLAGMPFPVLSQNDFAIATLIKRFRQDIDSCLLATDTFWEGIDMKGDTLRNLVIIRLPFRFPSHPFIKRYINRLEEAYCGDGFTLYTLPNAILKFKQGLGRLIRTKTDRGVVTVLDRRLIDKNYGKTFLASLPDGVVFNPLPIRLLSRGIAQFFGKA